MDIKEEYVKDMVSIIIPAYNTELYLDKCIESILSQTYKNIEVIIINDGSTDGTLDVCRKWEMIYPQISVINKRNAGVVSARKDGIKNSHGEFFAFIDSDDWIESTWLEKIVYFMKKNDLDIGIGGYVREKNKKIVYSFSGTKEMIFHKNDALSEMFRSRYFSWELADKIYSRKLFTKMDEKNIVEYGEDLLWNYSLFLMSNMIGFLPIYGYHYVYRENSVINKGVVTNIKKTALYVCEIIENKGDMPKNVVHYYRIAKAKMMVTTLKNLYLTNNKRFYHKINEYRRDLLHEIFFIVFEKEISVKKKVGALFFLLPYKLGKIILSKVNGR